LPLTYGWVEVRDSARTGDFCVSGAVMSQSISSHRDDFDDCADGAAKVPKPADERHPQLGELLAVYRGDITRNGSWLMSLLAGMVVCFGLFGYMVHNDGLWPKDQGLAIGQLVMAALGAFCVALLALAIRNANFRLSLYEQGLVACRGKQFEQIAWDDVDAVIEGMSITTYNHGAARQIKHKLKLRLTDGREVKLDLSSIADSERASAMVAARTLPRLVRQARAKLAAGQTVSFGYVKLRADGLERSGAGTGPSFLGWRDVAEYALDNGLLTIKSLKGWSDWFSKPVDQIENLQLLIVFLDHYTAGTPLPGSEVPTQEPELATH
jgi:uncharacterized protein DUF6585